MTGIVSDTMKLLLLVALVLSGCAPMYVAGPDPWATDPTFGARRNAYGPGVHMDATGRPFAYRTRGDRGALGPITPNAYGPGIGMDATGSPVTAGW